MTSSSEAPSQGFVPTLSGVMGEIEQLIYEKAPRKNRVVATAGALGIFAGIVGGAYNVSRSGLNLYIMLTAPTGTGKNSILKANSALRKSIWPNPHEKPYPFLGPGELISSTGYINWLEERPVHFCLVSEGGKKMKQMLNPKDGNALSLKRTITDLYSLSGEDGIIDPRAYADKEKGASQIKMPAATILFEGVIDDFAECLSPEHIKDGFFTRLIPLISDERMSYYDPNSAYAVPSNGLTQKLAETAAEAHSRHASGKVHHVPLDRDASAAFAKFDTHLVDEANRSDSGSYKRELYSRIHLNAMKVAALSAVSRNYVHPMVNLEDTMWATTFVINAANRLISIIENGDAGEQGGNEVKQRSIAVKVIKEYLALPSEKLASYRCSQQMQNDRVFNQKYLSDRMMKLPAFARDSRRASKAIKETINNLILDGGFITMASLADYGFPNAKGYFIENPYAE